MIRRVEARRNRARISRRELAARAGLAFSTLDRKLDGHREFTFAELYAVAAALGTTPSAFIPQDPAQP